MGISKVIYPDLSYKVNGILFETHNDVGRYANEKQYSDRVEIGLKDVGLRFEREKVLDISFEGETPGRNKADFIIEDKIVLEIKAKHLVTREDYYQVQRYLRATNKKLGILVNFRDKRIAPKRILNSDGKE